MDINAKPQYSYFVFVFWDLSVPPKQGTTWIIDTDCDENCAFIDIMPRSLPILGFLKLLCITLPFCLLGNFIFHYFWHAYLALTCDFEVFRHAHPGSPYVFGLVGVDHDLDFPEPMPVVGMNKLSLYIYWLFQ